MMIIIMIYITICFWVLIIKISTFRHSLDVRLVSLVVYELFDECIFGGLVLMEVVKTVDLIDAQIIENLVSNGI